jgi:monovalent cation:H+ antiporter-2, CPA2 family
VVTLRKANGKPAVFNDTTQLEGGDTLVLSGTAEALAIAQQTLLKS